MKFESKNVKGIRVQVPVDNAAKLHVGEKHESVGLGLWKPSEDKAYQEALKKESDKKKKTEAGKIARMRQN